MWFLQKAHTKRCVAENGSDFQKLVDDVTKAAEGRENIRAKYVFPFFVWNNPRVRALYKPLFATS